MAQNVSEDVAAIRRAYHCGQIDDDRTLCDQCKFLYREEARNVALGPGETPAHPPVRGTVLRVRCRKKQAPIPGRLWRCPFFQWA